MKPQTTYRLGVAGLMLTAATVLGGLAKLDIDPKYRAMMARYAALPAVEASVADHAVFSKTEEVLERADQETPTHPDSPGASNPEPMGPAVTPVSEVETDVVYTLFENDPRYRGEIDTIEWATYDLGLTQTQMRLLLAVRMTENGAEGLEFGIMPGSVGPTTSYENDPGIRRRDGSEEGIVSYVIGPGGASKASLAKQARWAALDLIGENVSGRDGIEGWGAEYSPPEENPNWVSDVTDRFDKMMGD